MHGVSRSPVVAAGSAGAGGMAMETFAEAVAHTATAPVCGMAFGAIAPRYTVGAAGNDGGGDAAGNASKDCGGGRGGGG
eukprot:13312427-Alexandrium_andersonii.AAC.1